MRGFLLRGLAERMHAKVPRVHPFRQLDRRLAAAACLDAGDEHDERAVLCDREVVLRIHERFAKLGLFARVRALVHAMTDFRGFEHRSRFRWRTTRTRASSRTSMRPWLARERDTPLV